MSARVDDALAAEWHTVMATYQRLMCALDRELGAQHGISATEFEVLQELRGAEDCSLPMRTLGEGAAVSQSALSRLVSRLEAAGLVERRTCDYDRRAQFIGLTDAGRERYDQARPTQRRVLREGGGDCLKRD
jgi:DNA-binding MarR family transcriptional regulator